MKRIPVIDSHTGGEPTRVVLDGIGPEKLETFRRAILCEPRGSDIIVGALLVKPEDAACTAGVVFFNNAGLLGMCGHGMIGVVTTLHHLGRIQSLPRFIRTAGSASATCLPIARPGLSRPAASPVMSPGAATGSSSSPTMAST
jgi:proline racemase